MKIHAIEKYHAQDNITGYNLIVMDDAGQKQTLDITQYMWEIARAAVAEHAKSFHGQ